MTTVVARTVSLYPEHWRVVEQYGKARNPRSSQIRSAGLQAIVDDWAQLRGIEITTDTPAIVDLSDNALEPFPASAAATHWWHVDGVLVEQDGDSTSGTRVASGATAQDAADKVLTACTTARGGTWQWATPPVIVRHANHRDDNCPVCKRSFAPAHSYNPELNHED